KQSADRVLDGAYGHADMITIKPEFSKGRSGPGKSVGLKAQTDPGTRVIGSDFGNYPQPRPPDAGSLIKVQGVGQRGQAVEGQGTDGEGDGHLGSAVIAQGGLEGAPIVRVPGIRGTAEIPIVLFGGSDVIVAVPLAGKDLRQFVAVLPMLLFLVRTVAGHRLQESGAFSRCVYAGVFRRVIARILEIAVPGHEGYVQGGPEPRFGEKEGLGMAFFLKVIFSRAG